MNVETGNTQALGALELVTGQRDRLRRALGYAALIADDRGRRLSPRAQPLPLLCEQMRTNLGLLPGDLGGEA